MLVSNKTYYPLFPLFFLNEFANDFKNKILDNVFGLSSFKNYSVNLNYSFTFFKQDSLDTYFYKIISDRMSNDYFRPLFYGELSFKKYEYRVTKTSFETDDYDCQIVGFQYFGARYYNSDISVWLSVDPMAHARSWVSPYNYCQWNPVMRIDPTGMLDEMPWYRGSNDEIKWFHGKADNFIDNNTGVTWERLPDSYAEGGDGAITFYSYKTPKSITYKSDNEFGTIALPQKNPQKNQYNNTSDPRIRDTFSPFGDQLYSVSMRNDIFDGGVLDGYLKPEDMADYVNAIQEYLISYPGDEVSMGDLTSPSMQAFDYTGKGDFHHGLNQIAPADICVFNANGIFVQYDEERIKAFATALGNHGFTTMYITNYNLAGLTFGSLTIYYEEDHDNHVHVQK